MAVIIDMDKCNGFDACPENGLCIEICSLDAIENNDGRPAVLKDACPECGLCIINCPNNAISKPS